MGSHRLPRCVHSNDNTRLLCRGGRLVPAIPVCLDSGRHPWRQEFRRAILRELLRRCAVTYNLGSGIRHYHPFHHHQRCAQRHRTSIQPAHAYPLHPAHRYCYSIVLPTRSDGRCEVPLQARPNKDRQHRTDGGSRTGVLLAQSRYGMPVYIRFILQQTDKSLPCGNRDSMARLTHCHPCRTDDIPCSCSSGSETRQWTVTDIHHPAQCLRTGFLGHSRTGMCHIHTVLYEKHRRIEPALLLAAYCCPRRMARQQCRRR